MNNFNERNEAARIGRYADLMSDAGFKAVFADEKDTEPLRDLLNVLLKGERKVGKVLLMRNELKGRTARDKTFVLDLRCEDENGVQFDVEIQNRAHSNLFSRVLCYGSRLLDLKRRGDGWEVNPVYVIVMLDGKMKVEDGYDFGDGLLVPVSFHNTLTKERVSSKLNFLFVQLGCLTKSLEECGTDLERWCYALKNMKGFAERPASFSGERLERLFGKAEIANFDIDKKKTYDIMMNDEFEKYWMLKDAKDEGREEGREEGIEIGILKTARRMLSMGLPIETVAESTELPLEQVIALSKS